MQITFYTEVCKSVQEKRNLQVYHAKRFHKYSEGNHTSQTQKCQNTIYPVPQFILALCHLE